MSCSWVVDVLQRRHFAHLPAAVVEILTCTWHRWRTSIHRIRTPPNTTNIQPLHIYRGSSSTLGQRGRVSEGGDGHQNVLVISLIC